MRIGVDVGGTNTDAVLMQEDKVRAFIKTPTTKDVGKGIVSAVSSILEKSGTEHSEIESIMIGTTQFTNAFIERKRLVKVGIIRLGLPASSSLRPLIDWPRDLVDRIGSHVVMANGGYQYDGQVISALDEGQIRQAAKQFREKGIRSVAISCVFSPLNNEMEKRAAAIVLDEIPTAKISISSEIGRVSLIERENATIMNASLAELSDRVIDAFHQAFEQLDLHIPFFISQNDGTLMVPEFARKYPVLTFASGPTNSMRGAAFLSGFAEAIVVDIGGTTTDVGVITKSFPRESTLAIDIGGVRTNFRMPDVLSIGVGGGSLVREEDNSISVGPDSVGYELIEKSLVFGGKTLTATDVIVAAGAVDIGDAENVSELKEEFINRVLDEIHALVGEAIDKVKTSPGKVDVVLVGGGSVLINQEIKGASKVHIPEYAGVANAIGASLAQVSGEVDRVFSYDTHGREGAMAIAKQEAIDAAIQAGANKNTVEVIDIEELPLAYLPGGSVRLRVKSVGDLEFTS